MPFQTRKGRRCRVFLYTRFGGRRLALRPKGGRHMPITLTFHIHGITVTVTLKRDNRHSAK